MAPPLRSSLGALGSLFLSLAALAQDPGAVVRWDTESPSLVAFAGLVNPRQMQFPSDYIIDTWDVRDGLPRNGVYSIAQTPDGYLWVGTDVGVARFDGVRFEVFSPYDTPGLVWDKIAALMVDRKGRLWIGSQENGCAFYENGIFTRIGRAALQRHRVFSFAEGADGKIWMGVEGGLCFIEKDDIRLIPTSEKYSGAVVHRVAIDSSSGIVYYCYWEEAGFLKDSSFSLLLEAESNRQVLSNWFTPRREGGLWFLDADVNHYGALRRLLPDGRVTAPQALPFPVPRWSIRGFLEDRTGSLWIAIDGQGVYRLGVDGIYERIELGNKDVTALFEDREGTIWAGSASAGLARVKRRLVHVLTDTEPMPIGTVCLDENGGVVFSTRQGDVLRYQGGELARLNLFAPYGLLIDGDGAYWPSAHGVLERLWPSESGFDLAAAFEGAPYHGAKVFFQSKDGAVWFGSALGGLGRFDGSSVTAFPSYSSLFVRAVTESKDGAIWTGHLRTGLRRFKDGEVRDYGVADGLPSASISALYMDLDDALWIGTMGGGLSLLEDGKFTNYSMTEGFPCNEVCSITGVDDDLWIGTTQGIVRVAKTELKRFAAGTQTTVHCSVFGTDDGLASAECVMGFQPSICRSPDGKLWFATIRGLAAVDPRIVTSNQPPPAVYIEKVLADDVPLPLTGSVVRIPPGTARLEARYTGINLSAPKRVRFQYRLDGHDNDWIDAWRRREAFFTKVPPGSYRLLVRAANQNGVWNKSPATLQLRILPYIWQTLWFKLSVSALAGALAVLAVWVLIQARYRHELERLERKQAVERERSRIAMDLHDQLGAQATQITFQSRVLAEQIKHTPEHPGLIPLQRITRSADRLVRGLDEIVWAANPAKDNLESMVAFISHYAQEYFTASPVRLRIAIPLKLENVPLPAEIRHELFLAIKEALANVLKHAEAREVRLQIDAEEAQLAVVIEDDGKGLPGPAASLSGNGLRNMKTRLENIGGSMEIGRKGHSGTRVRLKVSLPCKTHSGVT